MTSEEKTDEVSTDVSESLARSAEENEGELKEGRKERIFLVENSARSPHTKLARKVSPGPNRTKQYLGGGTHRVVRGRPLRLRESQLLQHMPEIIEKVKRGELRVLTEDRRVLDLETLEMAPKPPPKPLPNFRPDSIAHDKPFGENKMPIAGGTTLVVDPNQKPDLLMSASEGESPPALTPPPMDEPIPAPPIVPSIEQPPTELEDFPAPTTDPPIDEPPSLLRESATPKESSSPRKRR